MRLECKKGCLQNKTSILSVLYSWCITSDQPGFGIIIFVDFLCAEISIDKEIPLP